MIIDASMMPRNTINIASSNTNKEQISCTILFTLKIIFSKTKIKQNNSSSYFQTIKILTRLTNSNHEAIWRQIEKLLSQIHFWITYTTYLTKKHCSHVFVNEIFISKWSYIARSHIFQQNWVCRQCVKTQDDMHSQTYWLVVTLLPETVSTLN